MQSAVKKFGNSAGVLIPKPLLAEIGAQAGDNVDMRVEAGRIVIELIVKNPREGWAEDAQRIVDEGEDEDLWAGFVEDDDEEWTW
jgi:antitoxin MazE